MEVKDIVALAIISAIGIVLIVMSIIMLSGRGANLIAGYNTLSFDVDQLLSLLITP